VADYAFGSIRPTALSPRSYPIIFIIIRSARRISLVYTQLIAASLTFKLIVILTADVLLKIRFLAAGITIRAEIMSRLAVTH
jgi:hypothetical protein